MKKFILIFLFVSSCGAFAARYETATNFTVTKDQTVSETLFLIADQAQLSGTFKNDVFLIGGGTNLVLDGNFENDVWLCMNEATVTGTINDHLRAIANAINIEGTVVNEIMAAGRSFHLKKGAIAHGNVYAMSDTLATEGEIFGDLHAVANQATIAGHIHGSIHLIAQDIVVMPNTMIDGDLEYTAGQQLVLSKSVSLKGQLIRKTAESSQKTSPSVSIGEWLGLQFFFLMAALFTGLVFTGLFPHYTEATVVLVRINPLRCAFAGAIGFCLWPMLALFAFLTFVGIPLSILLTSGYVAFLYLGKILVALFVGRSLLRQRTTGTFAANFLALFTGLIVLYAIVALPWFSLIAWLIIAFIGLGAMLLGLSNRNALTSAPPDLPSTTVPDPSEEGNA